MSSSNIIEIFFKVVTKVFQLCCPCCSAVLTSRREKYRTIKSVIWFFIGLILGLFFYLFILIDLEFNNVTTVLVALSICLFLGIGNALSRQVRCISVLTFPSFCGKSGRGVLKAVVLAYVIGGPFVNLATNAKEVVRVFACTTTLVFNLTKTKYDLMVKPFQEGIFNIRQSTNEVAETFQSMENVISPIVEELEDEKEVEELKQENDYIDQLQGDSLRSKEINDKYNFLYNDTIKTKKRSTVAEEGAAVEQRYMKKLEYRCQDVLSKGSGKCRDMFSEAYDKCYYAVSVFVAWLLCWPMKLTFICNIAEAVGGSKMCDATTEIEPGFGEGLVTLKNTKQKFTEEMKSVKLQYEIKNVIPKIDAKGATDAAKAVLQEFQERKSVFDVIVQLLRRILTFIFIRIIFDAQDYHEHYLSDIEFDNNYITTYFKHIDRRRKMNNMNTLLPLKKCERRNFVDVYGILPMNEERKRMIGQTINILLEMVTATTFILLDRFLFEALDMVSRHSLVEYEQKGHHDMTLVVKGTGMLASVIRSILKGFNVKKRVHVTHSNEQCLPRPTLLPTYFIVKIYSTYFMIWSLVLFEGYTQRLRRFICSCFYRKREKRRILFLYNETLKRRIGFLRYMKTKIKRQARENKLMLNANWLLALRLNHPVLFGWLKLFDLAKRKCLICNENEDKTFYHCPTPGCLFIYCQECWHDIGMVCYGCTIDDESDTDIEDDFND